MTVVAYAFWWVRIAIYGGAVMEKRIMRALVVGAGYREATAAWIRRARRVDFRFRAERAVLFPEFETRS